MSDLKVETVRIGTMRKHENADSLSVVKVFDYPVVVRTEDYKEGDIAIYVPVDSMVDTTRPEFSFLHNGKQMERIRAKKLRGIFSMGLLVKCNAVAVEGEDWTGALGITKYEEPEPMVEDAEKDPGFMPRYTNIQSIRRYNNVILPGEEVVMTEKIHGANGRWAFARDRFWAGSHNGWKKPGTNSMWWKASDFFLERLKNIPNIVMFGEVYGQVQDLRYGMNDGFTVRFFDAFDIEKGKYLDWKDFEELCLKNDLIMVPILYRGPYNPELLARAEEDSALCAGQIREGLVIRPMVERYNEECGRVCLKYVSQRYMLRKGGTERH